MSEQEPIVVDARADERKATDVIRTFMGIGGLVALVLGALILFNPVQSGAVMMKVIAVIFACYMIVAGLVFLGSIVFSKTMSGWRRAGNAVLGLLYLIAGIIVFGDISAMAAVLAAFLSIFIGVTWIFEGVMSFVAAQQVAKPVWSIIYGIIAIIAGLVLIFSPILGAVTLWIMLGAAMVVMGLVQIFRAFTVKPKK